MSITHQLSLFVDVVQQGSFAKAAALHDMDNSLLSKQIKRLETELGVQLLNRSTRSFSLTSAGEEILEKAHLMIDTLSDIQNIADSYQSQPKGILRIAGPIFFGQQYLQPVVSRFMKQYPEVKISLSLEDRRSDIIADHFDVAFRIGKLSSSNLIAKKIASTHFAIVASQGFIEQYGCPETPEQLVALPAVIYSNGERSLDQFRVSEVPHGEQFKSYRMRGNYKVSDVRTMIDAVRDGLGYSVIDLFNLESPIAQLKLQPLLTNYKISTMDTGIYAVYPHRKQTLLVREFISAVQQYIGTPPFWVDHLPNYKSLYQ
ncbi:LysR family transcriptional regulator [Agarivorans sp. Toyoura001]|uniref:LysR family transcriptional regulator n=1 Tax=unclassified Agarivorans TaxID=2636026 RepID=UPI0010EFC45B|nr:LysR family transcriptional regulator [Agarivorans sp. Toyoura001]GDY24705.1 LysR family transcriptional regulator [Agarivorans sp. Toyoura001]